MQEAGDRGLSVDILNSLDGLVQLREFNSQIVGLVGDVMISGCAGVLSGFVAIKQRFTCWKPIAFGVEFNVSGT